MSVSGVGAYNGFAAGAAVGSASGPGGAAASSGAQSSSDASQSPLQYFMNYMKESPAKRMEDAWLAQHHLTEEKLAAMPQAQQDAIRKEMAEDIKKKFLESSGGAAGAAANIVV